MIQEAAPPLDHVPQDPQPLLKSMFTAWKNPQAPNNDDNNNVDDDDSAASYSTHLSSSHPSNLPTLSEVVFSKSFTMSLLILSTFSLICAAPFWTYQAVRATQLEEFERNFRFLADEYLHALQRKLHDQFYAAQTLVVEYAGSEHPATLPHFNRLAKRSLQMSDTLSIQYETVVHDRESWESYTASNMEGNSNASTFQFDGDDSMPAVIAWQSMPRTTRVRYNLMSDVVHRKPLQMLLAKEEVVASGIDIVNRTGIPWKGLPNEPITNVYYPVFGDNKTIVGVIVNTVLWRNLTCGEHLVCVVEDSSGNTFTYAHDDFQGMKDAHDAEFDHIHNEFELERYANYTITVYPTFELWRASRNALPLVSSLLFFFISMGVFLMILFHSHKVNDKIMLLKKEKNQAERIVSSLYPTSIREKMNAEFRHAPHPRTQIKNILKGSNNHDEHSEKSYPEILFNSPSIAELFPTSTVLFTAICGFDAWSVDRPPHHIFMLLETLFRAFDRITARADVFKVETISDSLMAVTGLPDPQPDHVVRMAKFARAVLTKANELLKKLEKVLGTSELQLQIGMHSGQVTGGVMRGEKSRFQLFGDTINFASRMESTGLPNAIQASEAAAKLLEGAGKAKWLIPRKEKVFVKGKGMVSTFWLQPLGSSSTSSLTGSACMESVESEIPTYLTDKKSNQGGTPEFVSWENAEDVQHKRSPRKERLIDWLAASLCGGIQPIVAEPGPEVSTQMRAFVAALSDLHRPNEFHSFERSAHVTMASIKLLAKHRNADPLSNFAVMFAAFVRNVDHQGVSDEQLCKERPELAERYRRARVSKHNSMDLAWGLFLGPSLRELRSCICGPDYEHLDRFREKVKSMVLATNLHQDDLMQERKGHPLELLMQAATISHTMQNWKVFTKWNERLFCEKYAAYDQGRASEEPSERWYANELSFFNKTVIPLARELVDSECIPEVCLEYALKNRAKWQTDGHAAVHDMLCRYLKRGDELAWEGNECGI